MQYPGRLKASELHYFAPHKRSASPNKHSRRKHRVVSARAFPVALPEDRTKIAIFVEPSPFSHISGMRIRFTNLIKGLRELGNDVTVVTPCVAPPKEYCGAKVLP